ncbi:hypothetical protein ACIGCK_05480 [Microbacterium sp. NPDC078428]|uniref:hypothetical protein n=1 Tax=Microbacterium sp. NPDC078428 TaxID=3364190 RepID=UPI0037CAAC5C
MVSRRHKVVTVERSGGYAARCEDCDAITFGGFPRRSDARAALEGHEQENAPAELQLDEGQAPTKGTEMNNPIITQDTDFTLKLTDDALDLVIPYGPNRERRKSLRYVTADDARELAEVTGSAEWAHQARILSRYENVEAAFRAGRYGPIHPDIQEVLDFDPGVSVRATGGLLYAEPEPTKVRKLTDLRGPVELGVSQHSIGRFYRFDGEQVTGLALTDIPPVVMHNVNGVHVLDDGVFVSAGIYIATEETTVDGEAAVILVSASEMLDRAVAQQKAEHDAFLEAHPAITEAKPTWATFIDIFDIEAEEIEILYGSDSLGISATYQDGEVTILDPIPEFSFEAKGKGIDDVRAALAELQAVLASLEDAERSRTLRRRSDVTDQIERDI